MLTSQSIPNEDGVKERFIQRLENAMYANQTINVGDTHPIDLLAQYQLGIRDYRNVVVYHNGDTPKNIYKGLHWETQHVEGSIIDIKKAMIDNSQYLCIVCSSVYESNLDIKDYSGGIFYVTKGINISSNEKGIGGALCIDDRRARNQGLITKKYPVFYKGETFECGIDLFRDQELMYQHFSDIGANLETVDEGDWLIVCLTEKFKSNPSLWRVVKERGGVYFLDGCTHYRQGSISKYQGESIYSLYICHLIKVYIEAEEFCDL